MNSECQTLLAEVSAMLAMAKRLNESGQHGAAMKKAYHATEHVAAAYLLVTTEQRLPPSDSTYHLFAKTIREPDRHPEKLQKIREVVGDISALREAYEPSLLDEITSKDAKQMIERMTTLEKLVEQAIDIK